ncbi:hypothetical protein U0C82_14095 [Fulvimarina sp. 2208YS6-2-32]|uniref:Uncharacterized protein n=1 Tax=Fulvimarina uroteuthidis TaxID=3098149 RepID=A0ABU5I4G2_9HYPH|nr:hypothetical protein [Fulvimarina sp. 2208YS6-2-32]MDY8110270.1 hypothetical protein [Fulvimarina sp. 2208YS6-2-32]
MADKLNETDARQGRTGRPILFVLIAGVALIVIGYIVVASIGVSTSPDGSSLEETEQLAAPEADGAAGGEAATGELVSPSEAEPAGAGSDANAVDVPD